MTQSKNLLLWQAAARSQAYCCILLLCYAQVCAHSLASCASCACKAHQHWSFSAFGHDAWVKACILIQSRLAYPYSQGLHVHIVKACILVQSRLACSYSQGILLQWWLEASVELPRSFLCPSSQLWGYQSHEAWSEGKPDNQSSHISLVLVMHVPSLSHHAYLMSESSCMHLMWLTMHYLSYHARPLT